MTIWETIYHNFKKGGQAWASIRDDVMPQFKNFVGHQSFAKKHAFDIGCGTGNYLAFLKGLGFRTDGIDSSETAVAMTKEAIGNNANILCADMFDFKIPKDTYDFIFSVSTLHHGPKDKVKNSITNIHEALLHGGSVFITLPDIQYAKRWDTFKGSKEIQSGTYIPIVGPEKGALHSFFSEREIDLMFGGFASVAKELDSRGRWIITGKKS